MWACLALGCKRPKQPLGAGCVDDMECDSLTCSSVGGVCSHHCTYDKECADVTASAVCRRRDEGGSWCSRPIGAAPGEACKNANDCQHNECLLQAVGRERKAGVCSMYCLTAEDCAGGLPLCAAIGDSGLLKVCLPDVEVPASAYTPAPRGESNVAPAASGSAPPAHRYR